MSEQDNIEAPEVFNRKFLNALKDAPDGHMKNASEAASSMIRRRIRENGFSRLILPPKPVSDQDLDYLPDTELPVIVEEMEPDSPGAKSIAFNDTADTAFYRGDKFVVYFSKITTPEFTKNIDELRTYKNDLRGVITDNALKDIQTEEDSRFIKTVDRIVGDPVAGGGEAGVQQHFEIGGKISRDTYVEILSYLEDRDLMNGVFLMNRRTGKEFLKFDHDELGGSKAEDMMINGLSALPDSVFAGVRHIFTIKRDLVPDNVVYQFAEPGYLGRFYTLQEVTMYVEKKKDILRFCAIEKIGVAFANVAAVNKAVFIP